MLPAARPLPAPPGTLLLVEAGASDGLVVGLLGGPAEARGSGDEHKAPVEEEMEEEGDDEETEPEAVRYEWLDEDTRDRCRGLAPLLMLQEAVERELSRRAKKVEITLTLLQTGDRLLAAVISVLDYILKKEGVVEALRLEEDRDSGAISLSWDGEEIMVFRRRVL